MDFKGDAETTEVERNKKGFFPFSGDFPLGFRNHLLRLPQSNNLSSFGIFHVFTKENTLNM